MCVIFIFISFTACLRWLCSGFMFPTASVPNQHLFISVPLTKTTWTQRNRVIHRAELWKKNVTIIMIKWLRSSLGIPLWAWWDKDLNMDCMVYTYFSITWPEIQQHSLRLELGDLSALLLASLFFGVEGDLLVFQKDGGASGVLQAIRRTAPLQQGPGCVTALPYVLAQF